MSLPVFELPILVFLQTEGGLPVFALFQVLWPGGGDELVGVLVVGAAENDNYSQDDEYCGHYVLLSADHSRGEEAGTVDLIGEVNKKLTVTAQLPLTQWAAVFAGGGELQKGDDEQHHHEVGNYREYAHAQRD
jgi:hypothetical protein